MYNCHVWFVLPNFSPQNPTYLVRPTSYVKLFDAKQNCVIIAVLALLYVVGNCMCTALYPTVFCNIGPSFPF